jgi:hypothetical protein
LTIPIETTEAVQAQTEKVELLSYRLEALSIMGSPNTALALDNEARGYTRIIIGWASSANAAGLALMVANIKSLVELGLGEAGVVSIWLFLFGLAFSAFAASSAATHLHLESEVFQKVWPLVQQSKRGVEEIIVLFKELNANSVVTRRSTLADEVERRVKREELRGVDIDATVERLRTKALDKLVLSNAFLWLSFFMVILALTNPIFVLTFGPLLEIDTSYPL